MKVICLVILLFMSSLYAACGFDRWINRSHKPALKASGRYCNVSDGDVQRVESTNFVVYFVTEGPHKTTRAFADSLSVALEYAYALHSKVFSNKMVAPPRSFYFQQNNFKTKYPVEILDLDLMYYQETGETCGMCFGLTLPECGNSVHASCLAIDNDFKVGATCDNQTSTQPIRANGIDYSKEWSVALRATAIHELYHTFQIAQVDLGKHTKNWTEKATFWLEASASGVEEVGYKEGGVYIGNLSAKFKNPQISIENTDGWSIYGNATLFLFLYKVLGEKFDGAIWNLFGRLPQGTFSEHLVRLADSLKLDAEDLFHSYAKTVFYSGARAELVPRSEWFSPLQQDWPEWAVYSEDAAERALESGAFEYISSYEPDMPLVDSATRASTLSWEYSDRYIWVFSRLLGKELKMPTPVKPFIAYPNPWRPKMLGNMVRFGPLPEKARGVEIRAANGVLIEQLKGNEGETLDWKPKKLPAPGVLYYRTLPHGKTGVLLIER